MLHRYGMEDRGWTARYGFWPPVLLWLPAGIALQAAVRFWPEYGLPLALSCRRLWRLGYRRGAWWAGIGLGAASVPAGLLGPVGIAVSAAALGLPVWIAWRWLAQRG